MIKYVIRLRRRKHTTRLPFYNVVVMNKAKRSRSSFYSNLGYIHYFGDKKIIALNVNFVSRWLLSNANLSWKIKKIIYLLNLTNK